MCPVELSELGATSRYSELLSSVTAAAADAADAAADAAAAAAAAAATASFTSREVPNQSRIPKSKNLLLKSIAKTANSIARFSISFVEF